ncbi:hypothetical protein LUZ60_016435 [Juncus effusus]|nr:hypothetical protein LUZ60_016435 [Juncus effusus]
MKITPTFGDDLVTPRLGTTWARRVPQILRLYFVNLRFILPFFKTSIERSIHQSSMEFCPSCGMLLQIEPARDGRRMRLFCPTCPYVCPVQNKIVKKVPLVAKEIEPIFNAADAKRFAKKTSGVSCEKCHHDEAYYEQMQTRSADEPETIFYQCCNDKCNHHWREG